MTFYAVDGAAFGGFLSTFLSQIRNYFPIDVSFAIDASGDVIDPITGQATGGWSGGTPTGVQGSDVGVYAAPVGALVRWNTGQIRSGRRVRGRTFLVPFAGGQFQQDGTLSPSALAALQTAANALVTSAAPGMLVFQRPRKATNAWTDVHGKVHPAKAARVGEALAVTTATVPDKAVVLRSRRD